MSVIDLRAHAHVLDGSRLGCDGGIGATGKLQHRRQLRVMPSLARVSRCVVGIPGVAVVDAAMGSVFIPHIFGSASGGAGGDLVYSVPWCDHSQVGSTHKIIGISPSSVGGGETSAVVHIKDLQVMRVSFFASRVRPRHPSPFAPFRSCAMFQSSSPVMGSSSCVCAGRGFGSGRAVSELLGRFFAWDVWLFPMPVCGLSS